MLAKKIGYSLLGIGIFIILMMLIADYIGLGSGGIQAAQLLGVEAGVLIMILGYFWVVTPNEEANMFMEWQARTARVLSSPVVAVIAGVLAAYFLFSIVPMFLDTDLRMHYFNRYLPDKYPIGWDLQTLLHRIETWFEIKTPYPGDIPQFYPPLTYLFFSPLTMVDYRGAFLITTLITLLSFVVLTLLLPVWISPKENRSVIFFLFAVSLFSYGLQFELERGQYNVLTFLFCLLAVYIFHFHHRFRYIAYFLFSIAVQLKVFPAIFVLMFVKNWRNWRENIRRFLGIGLFNFALLFILGYRVFVDFITAITQQVVSPSWNWNGNHSIQAFVFNLMKDGYGVLAADTLASLSKYSSVITTTFMVIFAVCLISLLVLIYRRNENGFNPYLFLVCTIGALILPTSNDYTLSFFTAPIAILLASISAANVFKTKYFANLLIVITSFAFSSTLFPFKYKPYILNNNFPALFIILISVTILYILKERNSETISDHP